MSIWDLIGWCGAGLTLAGGAYALRRRLPAERRRLLALIAILPAAALTVFVAAQSSGALVGFVLGTVLGQVGYPLKEKLRRRGVLARLGQVGYPFKEQLHRHNVLARH